MAYVPRDYQDETLSCISRDTERGLQRLVVNLPTGMGKTVIMCFAALKCRIGRVVLIMHREELINQTVEKLREICPNRTIGKIKAHVKQIDADIIVASVQTLAANPGLAKSIQNVRLIQVDECHHAAAKTYRQAIKDLGGFDGVTVIGYTATLARNDELGLGDVWQKVTIKKTVAWGEKRGYILPSVDRQIVVPSLDLTTVPSHTNEWGEKDYSAQALGDALINANAGKVLAREYRRQAGRRRGVVFVPTKKAAHIISDDFTAAGITNGVITGDTDTDERQALFAAVKAGTVQVLINCMVLTEGFDMPEIECVVIARITRSQSLFIQMRGRGTRPCPEIGKKHLLLLDTVGVTTEHDVDVKPQLKRTGTPVTPRKPKAITKAAASARMNGKSPATKGVGPAPGLATYRIQTTGRMVVVTRNDVEIGKRFAANASQAEQVGRLMVQIDQKQRLTSS
jgi:superfamily II DNA or RNA helicase